MYNPFAKINVELAQALFTRKLLLVRQLYERGNTITKKGVLLTIYDKQNDVEVSRALFHIKQLNTTQAPCLYDTENKVDQGKLLIAAQQPHPYVVYINLLQKKWEPPKQIKQLIHNYMNTNLHWWQYNKEHQLHIGLKDKYGHLYICINWKGKKAEVNLNEIDNSICATT